MDEVWYERITAIRLTQKDEKGELVNRYFPQVERAVVSRDGNYESTDWVVLTDDNGEAIYCDTEKEAIEKAIKYRDSKDSY